MLRVGVARDRFLRRARADGGAVTLLTFGRVSVMLDQHRVVDVRAESSLAVLRTACSLRATGTNLTSKPSKIRSTTCDMRSRSTSCITTSPGFTRRSA